MSRHTIAILEVSRTTYEEIKTALLKAGYEHSITYSGNYAEVIDMHGIALAQPNICNRLCGSGSNHAFEHCCLPAGHDGECKPTI